MYLRLWLTCLLLAYPLSWACSGVTAAAPALLRITLLGDPSGDYGFSPFQIYVLTASRGGNRSWSDLVMQIAPVVTVASWLLWFGRTRILPCFTVAVLGTVAILPLLLRIFLRHDSSGTALAGTTIFFAVQMAGCLSLSRHLRQPFFFPRLAFLTGAIVWPLLAVPLAAWALQARLPGFGRSPLFLLAGPASAFLACLTASLISRFRGRPETFRNLRMEAGFRRQRHPASGCPGASPGKFRLGFSPAKVHAAGGGAAAESLPPIPVDQNYPKVFFQRGVNFTAEMPNPYSAAAIEMLQSLPGYGVNAIALVPYGGASSASPEVRRFSGESLESDEGLTCLSRAAHASGIRVMLKPQLWVHNGWPANLDFASTDERKQWFRSYLAFLEHYARLAADIHADLFCVGVELARLSPDAEEWRRMIARIRELYRGPLVYAAAHGPEFEGVRILGTLWTISG